MKNSTVNSVKTSVQNAATTAVKIVTYPAHLVLQTASDLVLLGQAQTIKAIDGTPVMESVYELQTFTQEKQAYVVNKAMSIREKILAQRESNRQQDIEKYNKKLDLLQGVEHISTPETTVVTKEPTVKKTRASKAVVTAPIETVTESVTISVAPVPAPPVEAPFVPINKRPTMTAAAV